MRWILKQNKEYLKYQTCTVIYAPTRAIFIAAGFAETCRILELIGFIIRSSFITAWIYAKKFLVNFNFESIYTRNGLRRKGLLFSRVQKIKRFFLFISVDLILCGNINLKLRHSDNAEGISCILNTFSFSLLSNRHLKLSMQVLNFLF